MKNRIWVLIAGLLVLILFTFMSSPGYSQVPQQINYQGHLTDSSGSPLNTTVTMAFDIYDAVTGGNLLWGESQSVDVVNGNYNVEIGQDPVGNPFPADLFEGTRYLKLTINGEELSPGLHLASAPFAMKAANADTLEGQSAAEFSLEGHVHGWGQITGIPAGFADGIDDVGIDSETDPTITDPTVKDGVSWSEIQGLPTGFADGTDDVGITSETDPQVGNNTPWYVPVWNSNFNQLTSGSIYDRYVQTQVFPPEYEWRVGMGTENPQSTLHVNAPHDADGLILGPPITEWTGETYRMRLRNFFGDGFLQTASGGPQFLLSYNSYRDNNGTWNATYPTYKSAMVNLSPGTIKFQTGTAATSPDVTTHMKIESDGHVIVGPDAKHLSMRTDGALVDITSFGSGLAINYPGEQNTVVNVEGGKVGIGTNNPISGKLHVQTSEANAIYGLSSGAGSGIYGVSTATSNGFHGAVGVTNSDNPGHAGIWAVNHGAGPGIIATAGSAGYAGKFDGTVSVKVLEITGADLSEQYTVRGTDDGLLPTPGKVVSIDPDNPGDLVVSCSAYDRRVAGIISGAGDISIGMLMGKDGQGLDGKNPVALTGRVYCLADASNGVIEPGDLLTTSDTPGHAMKVTDYTKAQGAILGKSMSSLEEKKGMVLVLVTLQ